MGHITGLPIAFLVCLTFFGDAGCQRDGRVGEERSACPNTSEDAGVGLSSSAAVPLATAAPSGSAPIALVFRPIAHSLRFTEGCSDLEGASRRGPDLTKLEAEVSAGNACAAAELSTYLVESLGRPEDYARALALAVAAQNVGVALPSKLCVLFELANDRPGLAACYEGWSPDRLALMVAFGDGVPRDLARARRLASYNEPLLRDINAVDSSAPPIPARYCNERRENGSNRDMYECATDRGYIRDNAASVRRAAALDKLAADTRIDSLRKAFLAYRDVDLDRRWYGFLGGSGGVSGFCKEALKAALHEAYDDELQQLAGFSPPREASTAELDASARDLARAEAEAGNSEIQALLASLHGKETADDHARLLKESSLRYREYEGLIAQIARDRLSAGAERGLRASLRRERIDALEGCPR